MNIIFVTENKDNHFVTYPTIGFDQFKEELHECQSHSLVKPFIIDLETTGLTFNKNQVLLIALAPIDLSVYFVLDWVSLSKEAYNLMMIKSQLRNSYFLGHNLGFDVPFMMERGFKFSAEGIYDTMIVEQTLTKGTNLSVSLLNTIDRRCNVRPLDKEIRKEFPLMSPTNPTFSDRHIKYACEDLAWIPKIVEAQSYYIDKFDMRELVQLNNQMVYVNSKMKVAGMPVNKDKWMSLYREHIKRSDELEVELDNELTKIGLKQRKRVKERTLQLGIVDDVEVVNKNIGNINYGSSAQLLDVFYTLNIPRPQKDKEDKDSMGEASVRQYMIKYKKSNIIPFLNKLLEYKEVSKRANTFGKKWIDTHLEIDGRIRASFKINSTTTGRLSCSDPNLQQIPRLTAYRDCFEAPDGYKLWTADYASAELRIMASLSGDVIMLDLLSRGADLHGYCATRVYRYLYDDESAVVDKHNHSEFRTAMKNVIFGLSYGAGVGKIAELLDISRARAENVYQLLFDIFPSAFAFLEKNADIGARDGCIVFDNKLNQRRWFPDLLKGIRTKANISSAQRASKNSPMQGVNGQMIKKAVVDIDKYIENNNLESQIVLTVYDEIVVLVRDGEEEHCENFGTLMQDAGSYFLDGIKMEIESGIGYFWSK